ncbi:malto-oligosyltrehalose trehalohydrolase [Propionibacteriaceae bacterium Y1923]|uniref:malto-oligosyltrehalose trehalohydrolase n=1 Tax=Aestuariimicrobium sp. Y1814 TaxID=3418742 RepID=UPI003C25E676
MTNSFDVWAPRPQQVVLRAAGTDFPMVRDEEGWWHPAQELPAHVLTGDVDYGYVLDGELFPDPRSRWQPDGVHGLSRTFDPAAYQWGDQDWTGRQLAGSVVYELHVGTFTPQGTLDAAIEKLDRLVEVGVDLVELMPVNAFNGEAGWGYDGVYWYAVHAAYGGPAAYQRFVDACHQRGLGVIQDVVYNHFGPSGNYLPRFAPYLNDDVQTGWGSAVNLDGEDSDEVRRYILENARMWFVDHHVDGLRLDAVHALVDRTAFHLLEELAVETEATSAFVGRPLSLVAESDLNDPRLITARESGGYGLTAQWSDDFHHAVVANLTGDDSGYYADFASLEALAKVLETGFYHDGTTSSFRGRRHGRQLDRPTTPTWRLVVASDNHDQIGNRADGSRLSSQVSRRQLAIAAVMTLLSGPTPMVFQGEEWGADTPFAFFSSHPEPDLAAAVTAGRLEEFAKMDWDPASVLDPQDPATFEASKLDWSELDREPFAELRETYRRLVELRRSHPDFTDPRFNSVSVRIEADQHWMLIERGEEMLIVVNFGADEAVVELEDSSAVLFSTGEVALDERSLRLGEHATAVLQVVGLDEPRHTLTT